MFKFTHTLLLLEMLVAQGTYLCAADILNSQVDLKSELSDVEVFPDLVEDSSRLGEQLEWPQDPENEVPGRPKPKQRKVAFFVGLSRHFGPVSHITDLAFDNRVTSIGLGYSSRTSRFRAPVAGTYQFSVNVAARQRQKAAVTMVKNGLIVMTVWSESRPNWAPASNVAILSLKAGDRVWLQVGHHNWPSYLYGEMYTTFSGFLIFPD